MEDGQNMELGLVEMLTGMIQSTILADQQAADDYLEMIENYALEPGENGRQRLKMVDIEMTAQDGSKQVMSIPKISLLSLPSLRIAEAKFELEAELVAKTLTEKQIKRLGRKLPILSRQLGIIRKRAGITKVPQRVVSEKKLAGRKISAIRVGKDVLQQQMKQAEDKITGTGLFLRNPIAKNTGQVSSTTTTTKEQTTNLKISIVLRPSVLPDGMRGLLQEAQSSIIVKDN